MQDVGLDEFQHSGPVGQLDIQCVRQPGLLQLSLLLHQRRVHVARVFEDVLTDQLLAVRPPLDLRLEHVARLGPLQSLTLLVESR